MNTWREIASPIIREVLKDTKDKSIGERKRALFDAYPFGTRKYHPYKIWLDEIRVQTGKKKPKQEPDDIIPDNQLSLA